MELSKKLMTDRLTAAMEFANKAHEGQTRTTNNGEPYYNHVHRVMSMVSQAVGGDPAWRGPKSFPLLLAALLHDTVEDCDVTVADLKAEFGAEVAGLVEELTTDHMTHEDTVAHLRNVSDRAKLVKLADILDNISDLHEHPNRKWAAKYLPKKMEVVDAMLSTKPDLPFPLMLAVLNKATEVAMLLTAPQK